MERFGKLQSNYSDGVVVVRPTRETMSRTRLPEADPVLRPSRETRSRILSAAILHKRLLLFCSAAYDYPGPVKPPTGLLLADRPASADERLGNFCGKKRLPWQLCERSCFR